MPKTNKRKTRAQRKALIVAIVSSVLTVGFAIASLISSLHLPKRENLETTYETNFLEDLSKGPNDSSFILASHKNDKNTIDGGYLYHYDQNNHLIEKHDIFNEIKEKFGIDGLISLDDMTTSYETDSLFLISQNIFFRYKGLSEHKLQLVSYKECGGKVIDIACDEEDIFVISQAAEQYRIERFKENDNNYTPVSSGYVYDINNKDDRFELVCTRNSNFYAFEVRGEYVYIFSVNCIRRINKNLIGSNYRNIYEEEYAAIHESNPSLTKEEITQQIIAKYGWLNYFPDTHTIHVPKTQLSANQFSFYMFQDMAGIICYQDKIFFADKLSISHHYTIGELDETDRVFNGLTDTFELDEKEFPYSVNTVRNTFEYDKTGTTAMVYYKEGTSKMSVFDLEKETFVYTVDVSLRVEHAFYNEVLDKIVYKYSDPVNREAGYSYLSTFVVTDEINAQITEVLFIVFIILAAISFITSIVVWLCFAFKKVMLKIIEIGKGMKKHWLIYVVLFPSVFILCLFCYYPGIAAIFTSFFDYKAGISDIKTWNNFANYIAIFGNASSLSHFGNMIIFLLADVILSLIPPLIFAFFLSVMRYKKLSGVIRTLLFIPGIIPGIAGLLIWRTGIYGDYGLINSIIKASGGTPILFFQQSDYFNMIWLIAMGFPFVGSYLIFYGAMMNIPSSYYEAAEIDGISVFKRFVKIDIPLCIPQIKYVVIMTIIASIQNFSRVYVAMGGMPGVVSTPIVEMYMLMNAHERNYGLASAYATILFVILFFMTYLSMRNKMKEQ